MLSLVKAKRTFHSEIKMQRQVIFLSSPEVWQRGHGIGHPLKPERLQRTYELLEAYGAFQASNVRVISPEPASINELALFHTGEYIEIVRALSEGERDLPAGRYGFGPGDNPVFSGMFDTERLKVGSSLMGARLLIQSKCDVAFSYTGGMHHAGSNFASGFCVFNDAAVAIHWLVGEGLRVAYVDIDVHHGDGVQWAFYDTDRVLTISFHQDGRSLFPGTGFVDEIGQGAGEGFCVNVPLPPGTGDEGYLWAFREIVPPLLKRFNADIVVTQLGVDTHFRDPLAQLTLTTHGQESLFRILSGLAPRWLALGGGGYAIDVVPRAWTIAFGVMSGLTFSDDLPLSYQANYGGEWLHDHEEPPVNSMQEQTLRSTIERTMSIVKGLHKIT
jgi:acetoin utilization protein AcuC